MGNFYEVNFKYTTEDYCPMCRLFVYNHDNYTEMILRPSGDLGETIRQVYHTKCLPSDIRKANAAEKRILGDYRISSPAERISEK